MSDLRQFVPLHVQEGFAEPWVRWFAWRPVKLETGEWAWLKTIQRRRFWAAAWFIHGGINWKEYRRA